MFFLAMGLIFNLALESTYCGGNMWTADGIKQIAVTECAARKTEFRVNE